ncbi:uncharacterized protein B0H18DRAFT_49283 [Fomitopsis serialis]|uniref:uncharacterized protein n=1 Tax=Fomitopsis serialis TaxID=139415 RepID=UPI002007EB06|nr:uncharacterized protein B0H18DRAFT_49283 [Neoantrodia serialis]KAH9932179.1 hypothetical protein B0H18DRAFT_49283 [Neoantrodia serialis]
MAHVEAPEPMPKSTFSRTSYASYRTNTGIICASQRSTPIRHGSSSNQLKDASLSLWTGCAVNRYDLKVTTVVVGQMGAEPYFLLCLRHSGSTSSWWASYDPAPFAAVCLKRGINAGLAWHVGKIVSSRMNWPLAWYNGLTCSLAGVRRSLRRAQTPMMFATIRSDSFDLEPISGTQAALPYPSPHILSTRRLARISYPDLVVYWTCKIQR